MEDNPLQFEIDLEDETINVENLPKDDKDEILWIHKYFCNTGLSEIVFDLKTKEKKFVWKDGAEELKDPRLVKYWETWRMMLLKNESNIGKGAVFSENNLSVYETMRAAIIMLNRRRAKGEKVICLCIGQEPKLNLQDMLMMDSSDSAVLEETWDRPDVSYVSEFDRSELSLFKQNVIIIKINNNIQNSQLKTEFSSLEELEDLLKKHKNQFNNATIIENCYHEDTQFSFYTENFYFDYKFGKHNDDKFAYYCDNCNNFYEVIFKYLSDFTFTNLFVLSNCEDNDENILKENYKHLQFKNPPNMFFMYRFYFFEYDMNTLFPKYLHDKLYFSNTGIKYIKWRPEYYSRDKDTQDLIEECFSEMDLI